MWKTAKKYQTVCSNSINNSPIFEREYEAINKDEAIARAYLNCIKENGNKSDIAVSLKRAR